MIVRILSASPVTTTGCICASNVTMRAERGQLLLLDHATHDSRNATGPIVAGSMARVWCQASRSSISFCSDSVFSRTMRTMSRCSGVSLPPTPSRSSSAPSRTAVSGVFSSCDTWRRKRFCCSSSSASRARSHSSRWPR